MGAGRKGVGEGVAARRFLVDQPLEPMTIAHALRLQVTREGDRLTVAVQGHQVGHLLRFAGNTKLKAIQHAVEDMRRIEFAGNQLIAHRRPASLLTWLQADAILFIESFQCRNRQRRAVG